MCVSKMQLGTCTVLLDGGRFLILAFKRPTIKPKGKSFSDEGIQYLWVHKQKRPVSLRMNALGLHSEYGYSVGSGEVLEKKSILDAHGYTKIDYVTRVRKSFSES